MEDIFEPVDEGESEEPTVDPMDSAEPGPTEPNGEEPDTPPEASSPPKPETVESRYPRRDHRPPVRYS